MDYITFWIIATIFFWVLCAIAVVLGMVWVYCQLQYYKWDKDARERRGIVREIQDTIKKTLEELDREQYDDFENDMEDTSGGN